MHSEVVRVAGAASAPRNAVCELELVAARSPEDPWAEIALDVEFTDPGGTVRVVPAFWAGGRSWRVRYSSAVEGIHSYRTIVRAGGETGLEDAAGEVTITGYCGGNPLLLHGAPTVAPDGRHLAHADGTPFFWLADTWWSAFTQRFRWPDTFQALADDRAAKGFSVVQLVAGLVPEFGLFSPLMASEGGQPWQDRGRGPINPAFYDVPDLKIDYLVSKGVVPCIVGGWGTWSAVLGRDKVMQHWRYLVARYGAYPVIWCLAGEVNSPMHFAPVDGERREAVDSTDPRSERLSAQRKVWEDAARLVAEIDPYQRIRTVHPEPPFCWSSSDAFESRDSFELDLLQTGHAGLKGVANTMRQVGKSIAYGDKPVIHGECSYEGIFDSNWHDVQRFLFWAHMLSGTAGHTYGTMAISTFSSREDPYVPASRTSVHHWEDAIDWPGATHVGVGRRILERMRWWELRPAPEAVDRHAGGDDWMRPYAASLPDGSLVVYVPSRAIASGEAFSAEETTRLTGLVPGETYRATYVDPRTGEELPAVTFRAEEDGQPLRSLFDSGEMSPHIEAPTGEDWVLVVRPVGVLGSPSAAPW